MTRPVSQSAAWGSSWPAVEQTSTISFMRALTSFSILSAMTSASPTLAQLYVCSLGRIGEDPKKSLLVAPLSKNSSSREQKKVACES